MRRMRSCACRFDTESAGENVAPIGACLARFSNMYMLSDASTTTPFAVRTPTYCDA